MNSGIYQLLIWVKQNITFFHKKFGKIEIEPGYYYYTGSSKRNLMQRITRHLRKQDKPLHWHIDYLLQSPHAKIILIKIYRNDNPDECMINIETLKRLNGVMPIRGFGSSDCNRCPSHLLKVK